MRSMLGKKTGASHPLEDPQFLSEQQALGGEENSFQVTDQGGRRLGTETLQDYNNKKYSHHQFHL